MILRGKSAARTANSHLFVTALDDFPPPQRVFPGGDDYMVVGFVDGRNGAARGRVAAPRPRATGKPPEIGDLVLVRDEMVTYARRRSENLPREFQVLYVILSHPKKIFTRSELLDDYWGMTNETGLRTVDVYITKLRKAFAHCQSFEIVTVHGFGYKAVLK